MNEDVRHAVCVGRVEGFANEAKATVPDPLADDSKV
jgi:hypothetical protein